MKKLFLIDAMSLVFRAFHAMSRTGLKSPSGEPTGAVYGFANTLGTLLTKEQPDYICVAFDTASPTFRHNMYDQYKANRPEFPEDLVPQLARIKSLITLLGIPQIEMPGFEADDIIGTLSKRASDQGIDVYCVTSDKDYYQLVNDHVRIYKPAKTPGEYDIVHYDGVHEKFGVKPDQVIDVLALMGDSSDNIPGVKGVGEKTAIPLIQEYGNVQGVYDNLDAITRKAVHKKLSENQEMAFLSRELVTIDLDVPVDLEVDKLVQAQFEEQQVLDLFDELGFRQTLRNRFNLGGTAEVAVPKNDTIDTYKHTYVYVNSVTALEELRSTLEQSDAFSFDTETTGLDYMSCNIVGISFSTAAGNGWYVPLFDAAETIAGIDIESESPSGSTTLFDDDAPAHNVAAAEHVLTTYFKDVLESPKHQKIAQNGKYDWHILVRYGIQVHPISFDTMLASYLLNPDSKHNMDALAKHWLRYETVSITSLIGEKKSQQKSMAEVDPKLVSEYACEDTDVTFRLYEVLQKELGNQELDELATTVEFPVAEVLAKVEQNGVALDTDKIHVLEQELTSEVTRLAQEIHEEAGVQFNIDSPKQLGEVLFENMGIPPIKKTKSGFSTDASVLEKLAVAHPIAEQILEYRQLNKLLSTYVKTLPKLVNPHTGRIHTTYNQTIAATGRLSSVDPNLQNIPVRTALGKKIREAFVPGNPDSVIMSVDYSQIELRIMAFISQDETLSTAFKEGRDIHASTAAALFGVEVEDVDAEMRRRAKAVNFGIMYGLGAFGLADRLGIARSEARKVIADYFERFPRIREYIDNTTEVAKEKGYVETFMGRRRYLPGLQSRNHNERSGAERQAINMPIQGANADIMKVAMINIQRELEQRKSDAMMIMQVHDELVFEVPKGELDDISSMVSQEMVKAAPLGDIPVIAEAGIGENWAEAH